MLIDRLNALVWTCALELPVYAWWMRGRLSGGSIVIAIALGLQCVTQPLLWEYTSRTASAMPPLLIAEVIVWFVEAALLYGVARQLADRPLTMPEAVATAGSANLVSILAGFALNSLLYG
jgi:hypothetical protein